MYRISSTCITNATKFSSTNSISKRSLSYITGTHKHLTRNMILSHSISLASSTSYKKLGDSSAVNSSSQSSNIPKSFSNSRPSTTSASTNSSSSMQSNLQNDGPRRKPTLGADVEDTTKIINPVKSESGDILKVKISQRAANKLKQINESDNKPNQILRILVESGGCHGYQYVLGLKDSSTIDPEEDCIFERDGAQFVIDSTSLQILRDSTIDYTTELIGSQFKVVNSPYTKSSCGCGSSFDFDPSAIPTN